MATITVTQTTHAELCFQKTEKQIRTTLEKLNRDLDWLKGETLVDDNHTWAGVSDLENIEIELKRIQTELHAALVSNTRYRPSRR